MLRELLMVLLVVCVLVLASRWVFKPSTPRMGLRPRVGDRGLLRSVARVDTQAAANEARAMLSDAGIRSTAGPTADGRVEILVFPADLERARGLLLDLGD